MFTYIFPIVSFQIIENLPSYQISMGSSDKFALRWEDFPSNMSASFRELREYTNICLNFKLSKNLGKCIIYQKIKSVMSIMSMRSIRNMNILEITISIEDMDHFKILT